jgi:aprataxin
MIKRLQNSTKPFNSKSASKRNDIDSEEEEKQTKEKMAKFSGNKGNFANKFSNFLSLEASINDKTMQVYKDDDLVCIRDKYPKARFHLLLIPLITDDNKKKFTKVEQLITVLPRPIEFLKKMLNISNKIVSNLPKPTDCTSLSFKYGFHSIQSMNPLHMHIISEDFHSDCLKTKKHWNSFNTSYFVELNELIKHLELDLKSAVNLKDEYFKQDKFNLRRKQILENYLKEELKCNKCKQLINNMPNLKKHLKEVH